MERRLPIDSVHAALGLRRRTAWDRRPLARRPSFNSAGIGAPRPALAARVGDAGFRSRSIRPNAMLRLAGGISASARTFAHGSLRFSAMRLATGASACPQRPGLRRRFRKHSIRPERKLAIAASPSPLTNSPTTATAPFSRPPTVADLQLAGSYPGHTAVRPSTAIPAVRATIAASSHLPDPVTSGGIHSFAA